MWHSDYVDSVNEESLTQSFSNFVEKSSFKILGITKDKWKASTNAIKKVFHRIWIGYCHRHCLKKFYQALLEYQKETKCRFEEVGRLYRRVKMILNSSSSQTSLKCNLKSLAEEAFKHPKIKARIEELKQNAKYYTANMNRKGIAKTTSIVDNFLKTVKRKLNQMESFRDPRYAKFTFKAMANVRNFVPFCSAAKNAHKSPFMPAGGQTFDLPWIQVMNLHNAFLFCKDAF